MTLNIAKEIAALGRLTVTQLREKHIEVFSEQTRSGNKDWLRKRIAWRLQANAQGGLSERARQRAQELANDADLRTTTPKIRHDTPPSITQSANLGGAGGHNFQGRGRLPMPGAILRRRYKDREVVVRVLPGGFEWDGEVYRSLSAVAKAVTGAHWNGYHFFNLTSASRPGPGKERA